MTMTQFETPKIGETVTVTFDDGTAKDSHHKKYVFSAKFLGKAKANIDNFTEVLIFENPKFENPEGFRFFRVIRKADIISIDRPEETKRKVLDALMCLKQDLPGTQIGAILRDAESKIRKL